MNASALYKHFGIAIFLLLLPLLAWGRYDFSHLTRAEGLSSDACRCLIKDSRGFVWIGTQMGLNRYDGTRLKVYHKEQLGLESDYIYALKEDKEGNIWIGTSRGPVVYVYKTDSFLRPALPSGEYLDDFVSSFALSPAGGIWFCGENTPAIYNSDGPGRIESAPFEIGIGSPKYVNFLSDGVLFIAGKTSGLYLYNTRRGSISEIGLPADFVSQKFSDALCIDGKMYVLGSRSGLCSIDSGTLRLTVLHSFGKGNRPIHFTYDGSRYLWIGATSGLFKYDLTGGGITRMTKDPSDPFSLSCSYILSVAVQGEELWVATETGGVDYSLPLASNFRKSILSDGIDAMCRGTEEGSAYIFTSKGELLEYRNGTISRSSRRLPYRRVGALCCDSGENLWASSFEGIAKVGKNGTRIFPAEDFDTEGGLFWCNILELSDSRIYVSTAKKIYVFDNGSFRLFKNLGKKISDASKRLAEDTAGNLWRASYASGVYRCNLKDSCDRHHYTASESGAPLITSSIASDSSGRIWITGAGSEIYLYNPEEDNFEKFDRSNVPSFPDAQFLPTVDGADGEIWIPTQAGLVRFDPQTRFSTTYTVSDGLLDNCFSAHSLKLSGGNILMASGRGLLEFNPSSIPLCTPRTEIVGFTVGESECKLQGNVNLQTRIDLPLKNNSFSFTLATPGSIFCESLTYRLEGLDSAVKVVPSDKVIRFYNVPAGKYTLKIAGHPDLRIRIRPPFWTSLPGIILISVLTMLGALLVAYIIYRKKERKRKEEEKEREIKEKLGFLSGFIALEQFDIKGGDAEFLRRLDRCVTKHISDDEFSVKDLEAEIGMSHTTLNRKMASVLNTTPNEYIKTKRLAVALHLLRHKGVTSAEVCYRVGFSSPSYFAKCFKEAYGYLPSETLENVE